MYRRSLHKLLGMSDFEFSLVCELAVVLKEIDVFVVKPSALKSAVCTTRIKQQSSPCYNCALVCEWESARVEFTYLCFRTYS